MRSVADGVYRLGASLVNWFVVAQGDRLTVVDCGNPNQYQQLPDVLAAMGRSMGDVEAIVLTHAHGDHLGSAARIESESGGTVYVHGDDEALATGNAHRTAERHFVRDLGNSFAWKSLPFFLRGGATKAPPVAEASTFVDGAVLDIPGSPRVIHTPGHTGGSACLVLDDRGVILTGDALVTLSIVSGETGPMIMPGSFNADSSTSLSSLDRLRAIDADLILPGHGEPWSGAISEAVDQAVAHGAH